MKCIEDEIPFEVPEGWEWARLQCLTSILTDGTHKTPHYSEEGYIFLSSKNVTSGKIDWENIMYIPESLHKELYNRLAPQKGDILLAKNGTTGVAAIVDRDEIFDIYVSLALIRIVNNIIAPNYILNLIGSSYIQNYFNSSLKGIGVPNLHLEHIRKTLIPVPPYEEQHRINLKTSILFPLVEQLAIENRELQKIVTIIKTKILDLAIRGKLVPQNLDDEPASVLLEHIGNKKEKLIKEGKIKRDKKESVIFKGDDNSYYEKFADGTIKCIDEEIPFEIPDTWEYVRIKHIGNIIGGGTPKTSIKKYWNGNIPWLTPADLSGFKSIYISKGQRNITESGLNSSSAQLLPAGSILYSSRAPIGYIAIANNSISTNQGFKSIVPYKLSINLYLYYCMQMCTDDIVQRATGTTFKEISGSQLGNTIIPLPPLKEQQIICELIKRMMKTLTGIEEIIC